MIAVAVTLAVRLFVHVSRNAVNIFYNDQWDFYDAVLMLAHFFGARSSRHIAWVLPGGRSACGDAVRRGGGFGWRFWKERSYATRELIPAVLVGYGLISCAAAAYGRACFGPYVALSSRYTKYVELGMLGLCLYMLDSWSAGLHRAWARKLAPGVFLMVLLMGAGPVKRYATARICSTTSTRKRAGESVT